MQLVKKGRVFYIQIQEGTFGVDGNIIGEPTWQDVPADMIKNNWKIISEHASSTSKKKIPFTDVYKDEVEKYIFNTVFHKNPYLFPVTYDWRKIQLDNLDVGPNDVITGIRFARMYDDLALEVRSTPCDYKKGILFPNLSVWIGAPYKVR